MRANWSLTARLDNPFRHHVGVDGGTTCDLRWVQGSVAAVAFSDGEHLDDPSKLACSSPQGTAWISPNVRACCLIFHRLDVEPPATCEGCTAPLLRWIFIDGETHCSMVRSDEVQNGPSCGAKQRRGRAVSPIAGAVVAYPTVYPFASTRTDQADPSHSGVRVGRARETTGLVACTTRGWVCGRG